MQCQWVRWVTMFLVLLVVTSCATFARVDTSEVVKQRAMDRWAALIEGRLETAYLFQTPEYRNIYSYKQYSKKIQGVGTWQKAEVEKVDCVEKKCVVMVKVYVKIMFGRGLGVTESSGVIREQWIESSTTKGEWYYVSGQ